MVHTLSSSTSGPSISSSLSSRRRLFSSASLPPKPAPTPNAPASQATKFSEMNHIVKFFSTSLPGEILHFIVGSCGRSRLWGFLGYKLCSNKRILRQYLNVDSISVDPKQAFLFNLLHRVCALTAEAYPLAASATDFERRVYLF